MRSYKRSYITILYTILYMHIRSYIRSYIRIYARSLCLSPAAVSGSQQSLAEGYHVQLSIRQQAITVILRLISSHGSWSMESWSSRRSVSGPSETSRVNQWSRSVGGVCKLTSRLSAAVGWLAQTNLYSRRVWMSRSTSRAGLSSGAVL